MRTFVVSFLAVLSCIVMIGATSIGNPSFITGPPEQDSDDPGNLSRCFGSCIADYGSNNGLTDQVSSCINYCIDNDSSLLGLPKCIKTCDANISPNEMGKLVGCIFSFKCTGVLL